MIIRITGIDLLHKETEGDPDYQVFVEVGRVLDTGAEQILMFSFEAQREDLLSGAHRGFIESQVREKLLVDGPHKLIGDVWRTEDDQTVVSDIIKKATMAA